MISVQTCEYVFIYEVGYSIDNTIKFAFIVRHLFF